MNPTTLTDLQDQTLAVMRETQTAALALSFDFAQKLLAAQRTFAEELAATAHQ